MRSFKKTKNEKLQEFVEEYRREHGVSSVNLEDVAVWLYRKKMWEPDRPTAVRLLKKDLAIALRDEHFTDLQGRRVRRKHAERTYEVIEGRNKQRVLWHDITEASRPHMQAALQQRRHGIVLDCKQLKQDKDSYNENYNTSVPIRMLFDFTEDLEDLEHGEGEF